MLQTNKSPTSARKRECAEILAIIAGLTAGLVWLWLHSLTA
jgi:hypothetical protein